MRLELWDTGGPGCAAPGLSDQMMRLKKKLRKSGKGVNEFCSGVADSSDPSDESP